MVKKTKLAVIMMTSLMSMSLFTGCSSETDTTSKEESKYQDTTLSYPKEVVDAKTNTTYEVKEAPKKILSLTPAVTEVLCDLGLEDTIIGIDSNSLKFVENKELPQYDMLNISSEEMIASGADTIFVSQMTLDYIGVDKFTVADGMTVVGVPDAASIDDVRSNLNFLLEIVDSEEEVAMLEKFDTQYEDLKEIKKSVEGSEKSVFFEVGEMPNLYTTGSNTFLDEMITLAGGTNVFSDVAEWAAISEEDIISRNPEVYLTNVYYIENEVENILGYENFKNVTAIKNKDVYMIDNNRTSLANHKILDGVYEMGQVLHPEQYSLDK